jgi:hypothetical protein
MTEFESVCVHLFDANDSQMIQLYKADDSRLANHMTTYKKLVTFGTQAGDLINWIKQQIGPNKIHIMRIVAHGDSGGFLLGKVYTKDSAYEWWPLRGCFDPAGRVELHSCAVASETSLHKDMLHPGKTPKQGTYTGNPNGQGVIFMRYLASAVNAKVIASVNDQFTNHQSWSLGKSAISASVTVYPNGKVETQLLNPMVPD